MKKRFLRVKSVVDEKGKMSFTYGDYKTKQFRKKLPVNRPI